MWMHFDAGDTTSAANELARSIDRGTADHKRAEAEYCAPRGAGGCQRGSVVVEACSTTTTGDNTLASILSADDGAVFSRSEVQELLFFFAKEREVLGSGKHGQGLEKRLLVCLYFLLKAYYTTVLFFIILQCDISLQSIISVTPPPDARSDPPGRVPCVF